MCAPSSTSQTWRSGSYGLMSTRCGRTNRALCCSHESTILPSRLTMKRMWSQRGCLAGSFWDRSYPDALRLGMKASAAPRSSGGSAGRQPRMKMKTRSGFSAHTPAVDPQVWPSPHGLWGQFVTTSYGPVSSPPPFPFGPCVAPSCPMTTVTSPPTAIMNSRLVLFIYPPPRPSGSLPRSLRDHGRTERIFDHAAIRVRRCPGSPESPRGAQGWRTGMVNVNVVTLPPRWTWVQTR